MLERRPRTRLAAAVAASLVSLFVVVLGTASSQAATARIGTTVSSPGPTQAAPVDAATSPDVDAVALDLAGLAPTAPRPTGQLITSAPPLAVDEVVAAELSQPSDRGPPAV